MALSLVNVQLDTSDAETSRNIAILTTDITEWYM